MFGDIDPQTAPGPLMSINAMYTSDGYVIDAYTGNSISICYDENSQAFECTSGARILNIDYSALGGKKPIDTQTYLMIGAAIALLLLFVGKK